jgi:hypothetical protein
MPIAAGPRADLAAWRARYSVWGVPMRGRGDAGVCSCASPARNSVAADSFPPGDLFGHKRIEALGGLDVV